MLIGRLIGRLLLLAGLAVAAWDGLNWLETDRFRFITGGEIWFTLDVDSLNGAQAAIQRYGVPELWDPVMQTILTWPAAPVLLGVGVVLAFLCRR